MSKTIINNLPDIVPYRAAEFFLGKRGLDSKGKRPPAKVIAAEINKEFKLNLSRESVYRLVEQAIARDLLRLVPPLDNKIESDLISKYKLKPGSVTVVSTANSDDGSMVAQVAAQIALQTLSRIAHDTRKHPIGLGLGPGRATLEFCLHLRKLLEHTPDPITLSVVAIAAGCPAELLENAPISFINLLPERFVRKKVGIFAETLVTSRNFARIRKAIGVREAFRAVPDIDVVVTAMGDFNDDHDLLSMYLKESGVNVAALKKDGYLGNIQYRPYRADGPVKEKPSDLRAVTLFEIKDLVALAANPNEKAVILMGRQCQRCDRTRTEALRPILQNPDLRVFTHLVLDQITAKELCANDNSTQRHKS